MGLMVGNEKSGITLTELLVAVFILSLTAFILPVTIRLLNTLRYQQEMAVANQQIEAFISTINSDVNNAPGFVQGGISGTAYELGIPVFQHELGIYALDTVNYDLDHKTSLTVMSPNYYNRISYYVMQSGDTCWIRRKLYQRKGPRVPSTVVYKEDFLKGILVHPAKVERALFSFAVDSAGRVKKDTVLLDLHYRFPFSKKTDPPKRITKELMRWSSLKPAGEYIIQVTGDTP